MTPGDRLDIDHEARKLAQCINRPHGTRLVMWLDGGVSTFGIDTHTAKYMLNAKPHRVVGTYTPGVTVEQLAEDLAEVMV